MPFNFGGCRRPVFLQMFFSNACESFDGVVERLMILKLAEGALPAMIYILVVTAPAVVISLMGAPHFQCPTKD